jgi:hypothetical protein
MAELSETDKYFLEGGAYAPAADLDVQAAFLTVLCKTLINKGVLKPHAIIKELDRMADDPDTSGLLASDLRDLAFDVQFWRRK